MLYLYAGTARPQFSYHRSLKREFAIERIAVSDAPDPDTFTARRYFLIGINCGLQIILCPNVDRVRDGATTVIEIDCPKRIVVGQDIANAVSVAGLHSCQRR